MVREWKMQPQEQEMEERQGGQEGEEQQDPMSLPPHARKHVYDNTRLQLTDPPLYQNRSTAQGKAGTKIPVYLLFLTVKARRLFLTT